MWMELAAADGCIRELAFLMRKVALVSFPKLRSKTRASMEACVDAQSLYNKYYTLLSSFVKHSVASMNFLFLSWWRSSIWSNSASNFLCDQGTCVLVLLHATQIIHDIFCLTIRVTHKNIALPDVPSKTGPAAWGPACEQWLRLIAHLELRSHLGSHWSNGGCAGNEQQQSALWRIHHHNLKGRRKA